MVQKQFRGIISERIKKLREEAGLTSEQLAYQSGISKGGLSEIERNIKEPRIYTILKICNCLNISLSDFFNTTEINDFAEKI